jgi:hypothetical protein
MTNTLGFHVEKETMAIDVVCGMEITSRNFSAPSIVKNILMTIRTNIQDQKNN